MSVFPRSIRHDGRQQEPKNRFPQWSQSFIRDIHRDLSNDKQRGSQQLALFRRVWVVTKKSELHFHNLKTQRPRKRIWCYAGAATGMCCYQATSPVPLGKEECCAYPGGGSVEGRSFCYMTYSSTSGPASITRRGCVDVPGGNTSTPLRSRDVWATAGETPDSRSVLEVLLFGEGLYHE